MPRQRPPDTRDARRWPDRPPSTDRHAPAALRPAAERLPPRWHADPDEIETTLRRVHAGVPRRPVCS